MAVTVTELHAALRLGDGTAPPAEPVLGILNRLSMVASEVVSDYAPSAPEVVQDQAIINIVAYLYSSDPAGSRNLYTNAITQSGAATLLDIFRVPRARQVKGTGAATTPSGDGTGLTAQQLADLETNTRFRHAETHTHLERDITDLRAPPDLSSYATLALVADSFTGLAWDAAARRLTGSRRNGSEVRFIITGGGGGAVADGVVSSGVVDTANNRIRLTIDTGGTVDIDISDLATDAEVTALLAGYATNADLAAAISDFATDAELMAAVSARVTALAAETTAREQGDTALGQRIDDLPEPTEQRVLQGHRAPSAETDGKLVLTQRGRPSTTEHVVHAGTDAIVNANDYQHANYLGVREVTPPPADFQVGQWFVDSFSFHPLLNASVAGRQTWASTTWNAVGITTYRGAFRNDEAAKNHVSGIGDIYLDIEDNSLRIVVAPFTPSSQAVDQYVEHVLAYLAEIPRRGTMVPGNIPGEPTAGVSPRFSPEDHGHGIRPGTSGTMGPQLETIPLPQKNSANTRSNRIVTIVWTLAEIQGVAPDFVAPSGDYLLSAQLSDHDRFSLQRVVWDAANNELDVEMRLERGDNQIYSGNVTLFVARGADAVSQSDLDALRTELTTDGRARDADARESAAANLEDIEALEMRVDAAEENPPRVTALNNGAWKIGSRVRLTSAYTYPDDDEEHLFVVRPRVSGNYFGWSRQSQGGNPPALGNPANIPAASGILAVYLLYTPPAQVGAEGSSRLFVMMQSTAPVPTAIHLIGNPYPDAVYPLVQTSNIAGIRLLRADDIDGPGERNFEDTNYGRAAFQALISNDDDLNFGLHVGNDTTYLEADGGTSMGQTVQPGDYERIIPYPGWRQYWVLYSLAQILTQTVTPAAAATDIDTDLGHNVLLDMNRNVTLGLLSGESGDTVVVEAIQDATGNRTLAFGATVAGTVPTLSTGAGDRDLIMFRRTATGWRVVNSILDYAS